MADDIIKDMAARAAAYAPPDAVRQIETALRLAWGGKAVYLRKYHDPSEKKATPPRPRSRSRS